MKPVRTNVALLYELYESYALYEEIQDCGETQDEEAQTGTHA